MEKDLEWLDLKDGGEAVDGGALSSQFSTSECSWRASHACRSSTLRPLSNRSQKLSTHVRASPFEEWEGRVNVGMSSTVTASIRESVGDMAIDKIKSNEKADCAIFKQAIDQRTRMVLFKTLDRQIFNDTNRCISTGKDVCCYLQSAILATFSFSTN